MSHQKKMKKFIKFKKYFLNVNSIYKKGAAQQDKCTRELVCKLKINYKNLRQQPIRDVDDCSENIYVTRWDKLRINNHRAQCSLYDVVYFIYAYVKHIGIWRYRVNKYGKVSANDCKLLN